VGLRPDKGLLGFLTASVLFTLVAAVTFEGGVFLVPPLIHFTVACPAALVVGRGQFVNVALGFVGLVAGDAGPCLVVFRPDVFAVHIIVVAVVTVKAIVFPVGIMRELYRSQLFIGVPFVINEHVVVVFSGILCSSLFIGRTCRHTRRE
jgi:hypothetical protein